MLENSKCLTWMATLKYAHFRKKWVNVIHGQKHVCMNSLSDLIRGILQKQTEAWHFLISKRVRCVAVCQKLNLRNLISASAPFSVIYILGWIHTTFMSHLVEGCLILGSHQSLRCHRCSWSQWRWPLVFPCGEADNLSFNSTPEDCLIQKLIAAMFLAEICWSGWKEVVVMVRVR